MKPPLMRFIRPQGLTNMDLDPPNLDAERNEVIISRLGRGGKSENLTASIGSNKRRQNDAVARERVTEV